MVQFVNPTLVPAARAASPVSTEAGRALKELAGATQTAADTFTEHYEKEAQIQGERLLAETQADWGRRFQEQSKQAGRGFTKSFLQEFDAYRQDIAGRIPERRADEVSLALDKYRINLEGRALAAEAAAAARAKAAAVAETKRLRGNALISDPSLLDEYMESDPGNADYYVMIAANARASGDPMGVAQEFRDGKWDRFVSPSQKQAFIDAGVAAEARLQREQEVVLGVQRKEFEAGLQEEIAYAEANGSQPADSIFNEEQLGLLYSPEDAAKIREQYNSSMDFAKVVNEVNTAPIAQTAMEFADLQAEVRKPGNTDQDVARLASMRKAIEQRNEAIQADAATFVASGNDEVSATLEAYQASEGEDREFAGRQYLAAVRTEYDRLGIPEEFRRVLPVPVAEASVKSFQQMGADVAAQSLSAFMDELADPRVIEELSRAGLQSEYVSAMRHRNDPGLAARIVGLAGRTEAQLKEGLLATGATDMERELVNSLSEYQQAFEAGDPTGQATKIFNREFSVAKRLALSYMREGESPANAAEKAAGQMFPEAPIVEQNVRLVAPPGIQPNVVSYSLDLAMEEEAIRAFSPAPLDDPGLQEFQDKEVIIAAAQNGVWLNNSTGDGAILNLVVDGFYLPITNADGQYYEMKFSDMTKPTFMQRLRETGRALGEIGMALD